jgi:hypothetical protein
METANLWNFSESKGHNSVKNGSIVPKTELDLICIPDFISVCATSAKKMNVKWVD